MSDLLDSSVLTLVHPDDLPQLFVTLANCLVDQGGVGARLRLHHRGDTWVSSRWIVTPLADGQLRFGFAFSVPSNGDGVDRRGSREDALERHLWRIAREVEASGVVAGFARVPDPGELPGLKALSARQWEVLTRLLRGQRVPAIARELFLSQSTVRNHLTEMFRKLGVRSQEQLLELLRADARREARDK